MNSAAPEKATAEKASLPTSGKLRRLAVAVTTACVLATSTSAWAKTACYSAAEYDAEQAVRLHTEVMVIGLTAAGAGIYDAVVEQDGISGLDQPHQEMKHEKILE